ncbi:hypothetical protein FRB95_006158 [Tulasnella sp. JGI-2019a]|nr:hypothetical protein FRB95_006158 [Tulasnella sp. JGI-2019a]
MRSPLILAQLKQEELVLRGLATGLGQPRGLAALINAAYSKILALADHRAEVVKLARDYNARTPKDQVNDYDPDYVPPLIVRDFIPRAHDVIITTIEELEPLLDDFKSMLIKAKSRASALSGGWDAIQPDDAESETKSEENTEEGTGTLGGDSTFTLLDVPAEVLWHILIFACGDDVNTTLATSQVCQQLRQTVVSSPLLWTRIDINFPVKRNILHMERSVDVPNLEVHASLLPNYEMTVEEGVDRIERFWSLIEPEAHRIRDLHMAFVHQEWLRAAMPILAGSTHKLRFLDVGVHNDFSIRELPAWDGSTVSCQPRILRLRGRPGWDVQDRFWGRVEDFEYMDSRLDNSPSSEGLAVLFERLGLMQHVLRSLQLSDLRFPREISIHGAPVAFTALTHLKVILVDDHGLQALWKLLQTPRLESLTIFFKRGRAAAWTDEPPEDNSFIFHIISNNPQLVDLDLTDFQLNPSQWSLLFERLPNIKRLRIAGSELQDHTLISLYNSGGHQLDPAMPAYACPALIHLILENATYLRSDVVWDIVSVRHKYATSYGGSKLQSVVMRGVDMDHVREVDVRKIHSTVDHFVIEVFDVCTSEGSVDDSESEDFSEVEVSGDEWFKHKEPGEPLALVNPCPL